jgi:hypothetical protein
MKKYILLVVLSFSFVSTHAQYREMFPRPEPISENYFIPVIGAFTLGCCANLITPVDIFFDLCIRSGCYILGMEIGNYTRDYLQKKLEYQSPVLD